MKNIERLFRDLQNEDVQTFLEITFDEAGWHIHVKDEEGHVLLDPNAQYFLTINSDYSVQDALEQMDTLIEMAMQRLTASALDAIVRT